MSINESRGSKKIFSLLNNHKIYDNIFNYLPNRKINISFKNLVESNDNQENMLLKQVSELIYQ